MPKNPINVEQEGPRVDSELGIEYGFYMFKPFWNPALLVLGFAEKGSLPPIYQIFQT